MNDFLAPAPFSINHKSPREISLSIVRDICREHKIELWEIISHSRQRRLVRPRFAAYAALMNHHMEPKKIADIFNRDHTTIAHGLRRAKELGLCS
jgi:chromosomal replication initiation ATPase DnaA